MRELNCICAGFRRSEDSVVVGCLGEGCSMVSEVFVATATALSTRSMSVNLGKARDVCNK